MHRCLCIPEILHQIVDFTVPPRDKRGPGLDEWGAIDPSTNRDLAALARTSRIFLEPSLDRLWSDLATLIPVWTVLGVPLKRKNYYTDHSSVPVDCVETIKTANTDRLKYYLPRVRNLRVYSDSTHLSMIVALRNRLSEYGSCLCPNVFNLTCDVTGHPEYYLECPTFCGPNIVRLVLRLEKPAFMQQIVVSCPNVNDLEIASFDDDYARLGVSDVSDVVFMLPITMHTIYLSEYCTLSLQANLRLSTMSYLRKLSLGRVDSQDIPIPLPGQGTPFFPTLSKLDAFGTALGPFTAMLQALENPKLLWRLAVGYDDTTLSNNIVSGFLQTVGTRCDPHELYQFELCPVENENEALRAHDPLQSASSLLQPLFPFRRLQICELILPRLLCDDDLLENIPSMWPDLTYLALLSYPRYEDESKLTLRGLALLAKGLPNLANLALNLRPVKNEFCLDRLMRAWDYSQKPPPTSWFMRLGGLNKVAAGKEREIVAFLKKIFPGMAGPIGVDDEIEDDAYVDALRPNLIPHPLYEDWDNTFHEA